MDWCLAFIMEKLFITQSTKFCFVDHSRQKVYYTFFLVKYCWLWLFYFFAFHISLPTNFFHLLTEALHFLSVFISWLLTGLCQKIRLGENWFELLMEKSELDLKLLLLQLLSHFNPFGYFESSSQLLSYLLQNIILRGSARSSQTSFFFLSELEG